MGALGAVDGEEALHLAQDTVERPGLQPAGRLHRVAVHRVARPDDAPAFFLDGADQPGQVRLDLVRSEAGDQRQPPRFVRGIERIDQPQQVVGLEARAAFETERITDAAQELDMRRSGEAGAVADPQHVRRGVVPVAGQRILPGHRLLVAKQQRLVAGEETDTLDGRHGFRGDAARRHEIERFADAIGELAVLVRPQRATGEIEVPLVDLMEVGVTAAGERPQQVEGRCRLQIAAQHALRIGRPCGGGELHAVDVVAAIARQRDAVLLLEIARPRLGELPRHAPDLHHRQLRREGQHHRHLQKHAEGIADVVGMEIGEAFGTVSALQQKGVPRRDLGQPRRQVARLAGEDQRRIGFDLGFDGGERGTVGIGRQLPRLVAAPAFGGPGAVRGHDGCALRRLRRRCKTGGHRQFSCAGPSTRANSSALAVTGVQSSAGACAAISMSLPPMGLPMRCR